MTLTPTRLCASALLAFLALADQARADFIPWSYSFSSSPGSVSADGGAGSIHILPSSGTGVNGIKDILAAQLQTIAANPPAAQANFTNAAYSLTVTLHDGASGQSGSLTFGGHLGGWFKPSTASITNKFNNPITQQLTLGQDLYVVTIGSFSSPGGSSSGTFGRIGADVLVSGPGTTPPRAAPEPGTLALAALGASALAARQWWQRRRGARGPRAFTRES
jgi:hypothetical protein